MPRTVCFLALLLVAFALLLVACGGERSEPEFYTQAELEHAIEERFPEYKWPENFEISADNINRELQFPNGARFEPQYEYVVIGGYHTCAWEVTLINAVQNSNEQLIDESKYQLTGFESSEYRTSLDVNAQESKNKMYNHAIMGTPTTLKNWVNNNCRKVMPYFEDSTSQRLSFPVQARYIHIHRVYCTQMQ